MIDIIIPVYNAKKTLTLTLMSINIQTIKKQARIYIVDDCSEDNYDEIIEYFKGKLDIIYLRITKNVGSGLARQYGIDHSNSEYILFLDSDDLFYNTDSLKILYQTITQKKLEYVFSDCYNEINQSKYFSFSDLHGKIYKRSFLMANNIKFNETRFHEDNAFNNLVIIHEPTLFKIDDITYIYCDNKNSITKVDDKTEFSRLKIFIYNICYVIDVAKQHNCNKLLIKEYLYNKIKYLRAIYLQSSKEEKIKIKLWLYKYNLKCINYLTFTNNNMIRKDIANYFKI